jgi:hypothetical protein
LEAGCRAGRERGLLNQAGTRWIPTVLGRRFLNDLQTLFLTDSPDAAVDGQNRSGVAALGFAAVAGRQQIG